MINQTYHSNVPMSVSAEPIRVWQPLEANMDTTAVLQFSAQILVIAALLYLLVLGLIAGVKHLRHLVEPATPVAPPVKIVDPEDDLFIWGDLVNNTTRSNNPTHSTADSA